MIRRPPRSTLFPTRRSSDLRRTTCCPTSRACPARSAASTGRVTAAERAGQALRSEEHTSELQSPDHLVCRLLLEKKKKNTATPATPQPRKSYCRRGSSHLCS